MNDNEIKAIEERLAKRKSYYGHARDPIAEADMDTLLDEVKRRGELVEHYQNQSKLNHEGHLEFIALSSNLQQRVEELEGELAEAREAIRLIHDDPNDFQHGGVDDAWKECDEGRAWLAHPAVQAALKEEDE